jgi:pimeloyl-ACP methyl ester carboxylesterase
VTLISGWGYSARFFRESISPLLQADKAVDLASLDRDPAANPPAYAKSLCHEVETDRPQILCGWSTGAMVALEAAVLQPELVKGLILFAPTARYCRTDEYTCGVDPRELRALSASCKRKPQETLSAFQERCGARPGSSDDIPSTEILLRGLNYLTETDLRSILGHIHCPVLIFHGTADNIVPLEAGLFLAEKLTDATFCPIAESGHACFLDAKDAVRDKIGVFLQQTG